MRTLLVLLSVLVSGCIGVHDMTASQIRATNGMAMCSQLTSIYGKGSSITVNADDIRKGVSSKGKTEIACGDARMVIEHDQGVAK